MEGIQTLVGFASDSIRPPKGSLSSFLLDLHLPPIARPHGLTKAPDQQQNGVPAKLVAHLADQAHELE